MIKDSIVIVIVLAVNGALKIFELVYQMTNGGPNHKSETAVTYMYYIMFKSASILMVCHGRSAFGGVYDFHTHLYQKCKR